MTTQAQRRRTYEHLRLFFEMYDLPHCLAELERAGRKTIETNSRLVSTRKGERKNPPVSPVVSYLGTMENQPGGCSQATGARESANVRRAPVGRNNGG